MATAGDDGGSLVAALGGGKEGVGDAGGADGMLWAGVPWAAPKLTPTNWLALTRPGPPPPPVGVPPPRPALGVEAPPRKLPPPPPALAGITDSGLGGVDNGENGREAGCTLGRSRKDISAR